MEQKEILVVDDSPASLQLLTGILTDRGYRVRPASGGTLALRSAAARQPDLILLDVRMPDLDGFEVCRRLKSDEKTRSIPVLFISAAGETLDKVTGFEAGGVDYITKPFQADEVAARVGTQLRLRDMAKRLQEAKESLEKRVEERTAELASANRVLEKEITERRRAEQEMQRLTRRIELILNSAGEGIFGLDMDGNYTFMNKAAAAMLGYGDRELFGKHSHTCIHFKHADGTPYPEEACLTYAAFRDGEVHRVDDECFCRKDGTFFPIEYTSTPILENGKISGAVVNFKDTTERRRAEDALKLIQFSVDRASVSVFLIGPDARLLYVNEQACRTLGYSRQELLSSTVYDLDPNFPSSGWEAHWAGIKKEGFRHLETLHRRKDGTLIAVSVSVNFVAFGGKEYQWAFAQDISERKRTENELKQSYQLTKTIIDSMNDAISLIDVRDFTLIGVNSVFLKEYGFSDESEVLGKHCYEITHRRKDFCTAPDDICPLAETVKSGGHFAVDHVHYGAQGEKIYVEVTTSPITDENGKVVQVVHVSRDITERKRAEQERERMLADIARSNKELEQFAYVASHDLQEPLRMVAAYMGLLEKKYHGRLDDKADRYIHFAVDGALRMQRLIDGLLAYSRIASRGSPFRPVDLNHVFEDAVKNLSEAVRESSARITKDDLPVVTADETQMLQLFQNLIANAIKFRTPDAPPEIHIAAGKKGNEWTFRVRDNGIGIESEYFDRVFQIFQRLHSPQEYAGTGIGLAVCKKIVERHRGRIWIESAPGKGSTFFFTIPSPH